MSTSEKAEVPVCLKRLVRTIIRSFYSRENSLIIDLLVRNTIMKEDDMCERLRFEKKQLRQHLHTLKSEQFIKSKLQLETDAEGKIAKIIHYFIDYKVFVNIVKYRLDQMQRRLEAEQRQNTCRALFRCQNCTKSYTDLEVDRLLDMTTGALICVFCRNEVKEEEDNVQRTDIRASVSKFHQTVRGPLDKLLKECDRIHLSSSILEPEFRVLEPLPGSISGSEPVADDPRATNSWLNDPNKLPGAQSTECKITIVLDAPPNMNSIDAPKERPIWMSVSTVDEGGIGELKNNDAASSSLPPDSSTQTLAPGRVPTNLTDTSRNSDAQSSINPNPFASANSSDIMQLLRVHERRGLGSHGPKTALNRPHNGPTSKSGTAGAPSLLINHRPIVGTRVLDDQMQPDNNSLKYMVKLNDRDVLVSEIPPSLVKKMSPALRDEYSRVGRLFYRETIVD